MTIYKRGDRVDITIKGAHVVAHGYDDEQAGDYITVTMPVAKEEQTIHLETPGVTVEYGAPAGWPPRPGDLWRDTRGGLWFAADVRDTAETDEPEIALVSQFEAYEQEPDEARKAYGPLSRVYRQEGVS